VYRLRVPYRLVCLDAGFTLIRPVESMAERLGRVLADHGHVPDEEELRRAWDAADAWFWDEYHRPGNDTWSNDERITATWRSYHRLMLGRLGFADQDREVLESVLVAQTATEAWEPYEDTMPALERLRGMRTGDRASAPRVAVVSDWGSTLTPLLEGLGIAEYVDDILASGAVGVAKPTADFFLLACRRAGVPPAEAMMIGDSYRADVAGAAAAGLTGVLLDRAGTAIDIPSGVAVVGSLLEALDLVANGRSPDPPSGSSARR